MKLTGHLICAKCYTKVFVLTIFDSGDRELFEERFKPSRCPRCRAEASLNYRWRADPIERKRGACA